MNMEDNSHYSKIRFFVQKTNKVINSSFWTQFDGRFEFEKFGSFQYFVSSISARKCKYLILLNGKKSVIKSRKFEIRLKSSVKFSWKVELRTKNWTFQKIKKKNNSLFYSKYPVKLYSVQNVKFTMFKVEFLDPKLRFGTVKRTRKFNFLILF